MQLLYFLLIILFISISALCALGNKQQKVESSKNTFLYKKYYSRSEIDKLLRNLAKYEKVNKKEVITATCYIFMPICPQETKRNKRVNYICPKCKKKTIYLYGVVPENLDLLRIRVSALKHIKAELIEIKFCKHCSPEEKFPTMGIKILYDEPRDSVITYGISEDDISLLHAFTNLDFDLLANNEAEKQRHLRRLRVLLGIAPEK